ncbi:hypothetical protein TIFTF001_025900 [Ficus carica]|uniref:Uncharacterized protein n=1 Tax=Ficus carica TaxID=3494 RepID=A0AA88ANP3_FICCA|nr:hypothetical protein TIFTF001_025900 [Ficus carica]
MGGRTWWLKLEVWPKIWNPFGGEKPAVMAAKGSKEKFGIQA